MTTFNFYTPNRESVGQTYTLPCPLLVMATSTIIICSVRAEYFLSKGDQHRFYDEFLLGQSKFFDATTQSVLPIGNSNRTRQFPIG